MNGNLTCSWRGTPRSWLQPPPLGLLQRSKGRSAKRVSPPEHLHGLASRILGASGLFRRPKGPRKMDYPQKLVSSKMCTFRQRPDEKDSFRVVSSFYKYFTVTFPHFATNLLWRLPRVGVESFAVNNRYLKNNLRIQPTIYQPPYTSFVLPQCLLNRYGYLLEPYLSAE